MSDAYDELAALDQVNLQVIEENKKLKAERDRYKAALEKIASLTSCYQTLERLQVARKALK